MLCDRLVSFLFLDIIMRVRNKAEIIPCRPRIYEISGNLYGFVALIRECWDEDPSRRPVVSRIRSRLREISGGKYQLSALYTRRSILPFCI